MFSASEKIKAVTIRREELVGYTKRFPRILPWKDKPPSNKPDTLTCLPIRRHGVTQVTYLNCHPQKKPLCIKEAYHVFYGSFQLQDV